MLFTVPKFLVNLLQILFIFMLAACGLCYGELAQALNTNDKLVTKDGLKPFSSEAELSRQLSFMKDSEAAWLSRNYSYPRPYHNIEPLDGIRAKAIVYGNYLVIMRGERLYTIDIGAGRLKTVGTAYASPRYSESRVPKDFFPTFWNMLIGKNIVVVIARDYWSSALEVNLFDLSASGDLRYRATYGLHNSEYLHSALMDNKLVIWTSSHLQSLRDLPGLGRLPLAAGRPENFRRIVPAAQIYQTENAFQRKNSANKASKIFLSQKARISCLIDTSDFSCQATVLLSKEEISTGKLTLCASSTAAYFWGDSINAPDPDDDRIYFRVFRLPHDGSVPTALVVEGKPVGECMETPDGYLNALLKPSVKKRGWGAKEGWPLLRVPLTQFGNSTALAPEVAYRRLTAPQNYYQSASRFIGDYLLYGDDALYSPSFLWGIVNIQPYYKLHIIRWHGGLTSLTLPLQHGVEAIHKIGLDALVIGRDAERKIHISTIRLSDKPYVVGHFVQKLFPFPNGGRLFSFSEETNRETWINLGVLSDCHTHPIATLIYLRNDNLRLDEVGAIQSSPQNRLSNCELEKSLIPISANGRLFAVTGNELVELRVEGKQLAVVQRLRYARE